MHNGIGVVSDSFAYPFSLDLSYSVLLPNKVFFDYKVSLDHAYQRTFTQGSALGGIETDINTVQTCGGTEVSLCVLKCYPR